MVSSAALKPFHRQIEQNCVQIENFSARAFFCRQQYGRSVPAFCQGVDTAVLCAVPLAPRKFKIAGVMSEVKVVGDGWIALASYQRKGYAYIAP